jgi:hypothetical protein
MGWCAVISSGTAKASVSVRAPSASLLGAAKSELATWVAQKFG